MLAPRIAIVEQCERCQAGRGSGGGCCSEGGQGGREGPSEGGQGGREGAQ